MTRAGAAVTVRTVRSHYGAYLSFRAARPDVPELRVTLDDDGVLREARAELDRALTALKNAIPDLTVSDADAPEVYRRLRLIGLQQMFMIFSRPRIIQDVQDFWRAALPAGPAPLIQCVGDLGALLPIEYLAIGSLQPPETIRGRAGLIAACRQFLGFSAVVQRSFLSLPVPLGTGLRTGADGRLPLRFFRHDDLPGADRELAWFTGVAADRVALAGPHPGDPDEPTLSARLAEPGADQVQHFACHCYATSDKPLDNEIELSGGGRTVRVRLRDLIADTAEHLSRSPTRHTEMPLIVMNACGASRIAATGALSFPWFFLKNGNRGFVGSDIEIPDDVAAEFSATFYARLVLARQPLGTAFLTARNHLLRRYGNPLGICYSAYADPDLRMTTAHAGPDSLPLPTMEDT